MCLAETPSIILCRHHGSTGRRDEESPHLDLGEYHRIQECLVSRWTGSLPATSLRLCGMLARESRIPTPSSLPVEEEESHGLLSFPIMPHISSWTQPQPRIDCWRDADMEEEHRQNIPTGHGLLHRSSAPWKH
jgi:hypothetical protein